MIRKEMKNINIRDQVAHVFCHDNNLNIELCAVKTYTNIVTKVLDTDLFQEKQVLVTANIDYIKQTKKEHLQSF